VSEQSQRAAIARHLKAGRSLTALEALQKFGCLRLAGRIFELKQQGADIHNYRVKVPNGKTWKYVSAYYQIRRRAA
jgi:hypothetical protein